MPLTPRFWVANRVRPGAIDLLFRLGTADLLSPAARHRFIHAGIGPEHLADTLGRVRAIRAWPISWVQTAHTYLRAARQDELRGDERSAALARANGALCYHFAQIFELRDIERKRRLYRRAAALFRSAAPELASPAYPVDVPWRDLALPGSLRLPSTGQGGGPYPLIVMLNGASTVKEETIRWAGPFVERGLATLALDTPGSGEAWDQVLGEPGQEDIAEALVRFGERHPAIDAQRIAVLGISLRGALAVQLAAACPRLAAAVAVTAPFHPEPYFRHLSPLILQELEYLTGLPRAELRQMVGDMSLIDVAPKVRQPLLVVGAGNDLIVPPEESLRLYQGTGGPKHLHFIPGANHVAFSHMAEWGRVAAAWLAETLREGAPRRQWSSIAT